MKNTLFFLILLFLATSCEKDPVFIPDRTELEPGKNKPPFVTICMPEGNGSSKAICIPETDVKAYLEKGAFLPDRDGDGYTAFGACTGQANDCDDDDPNIHPGAKEICGDGLDNNCDGHIDEGCVRENKPPQLFQPEAGALMDNGCTDRSDMISWFFDWGEVPGATKYHLYVMGRTATIPVINLELTQSQYLHQSMGSYIINTNTLGWTWKVRAFINGTWSDWSERRVFDAEPLNTDCSN